MGADLVLAVDLGSGGPKVGFHTVTGEPVWWWYERASAVHGAAVQDPNMWWDTIIGVAASAITSGAVDGSRVVGIACTGQWASTVPVDADGLPVAECLMWSDTRGAEHSARRFGGPVLGYAARPLATWLCRSGGVPSPTGADPIAHMLHLRHDRPEVPARWHLEPVDYLTMRFTGVAAATPASMTAAWLTDNRDLGHAAYDPVLVGLAGVDADRLPPLRPTGSIIGPVRSDVAEALGIPSATMVLAGTPDLQNAIVGSGAIDAPHASLGTSAWISCPVPAKKTDVLRSLASVPGIGDGNYVLADNQDNAGRALEWFRDAFAPDLSYADLLAAADSVPAGSGRVLFTPWLNGERSPVDDRADVLVVQVRVEAALALARVGPGRRAGVEVHRAPARSDSRDRWGRRVGGVVPDPGRRVRPDAGARRRSAADRVARRGTDVWAGHGGGARGGRPGARAG